MSTSLEFWAIIYGLIAFVIGLFMVLLDFVMKHRPMDFDWVREVKTWTQYLKLTKENLKGLWKAIYSMVGMGLLWPIIIVIAVIDYSKPKYERDLFNFWRTDPAEQFKCQRAHLVRKVSPEEAEAAAMVADPMGRAPKTPFGHLHSGWVQLLAQKTNKHTLWWFEIPAYVSEEDAGKKSVIEFAGYALAKGRSVRAEFFVEWS